MPRTIKVTDALYDLLLKLRGPRTKGEGKTMSDTILDYVACPECGKGNLSESDDGCIVCDNCDFEDCLEDEDQDQDDQGGD